MSTTDDDGWGETAEALGKKASAGDENKKDAEAEPEPEPGPGAKPESISGDAYDRELRGEPEKGKAKPAPKAEIPEPEPYTPPKVDKDLRVAAGVKEDRPAKKTKAKKKTTARRGSGGGDDGDGDGDDPDRPRRSRRRLLVALLLGAVSISVAAVVLVGKLNAQRYYLVCHADKITAERGRSFPPWGRAQISGDAWQPIELGKSIEITCDTTELDSRDALEVAYFDALVGQAETLLAREAPASGEITSAEKQLRQALQLARPSQRKTQRDKIRRLLGDVAYWRARRKVEGAASSLRKATEQLEEATEANPRYVRDADAWRRFAAAVAAEIEAGPHASDDAGADVPPTIPPGDGDAAGPLDERPDAGPGVALPPEADAGAAPVLGPPDAGIPTGGVLM